MPRKAHEKYKEKHGLKTMSVDIPVGLRDQIYSIADELGCPKSQVASALLYAGLDRNINLRDYLQPSQSPIFKHTIDLDKLRKDLT